MKVLLAFALVFSASAAFASQLNIDVTPNGGATHLEFIEQNGVITTNGNGPFSGHSNQTYVVEKADGTLQGFVFGTPFNLSCTAIACVDKGSTDVRIAITKSGSTTNYDGTIQYHFVHATVSEAGINVSSDGSFNAPIVKGSTYEGSGAFSRVRYGSFTVRLAASGGFDLNDPRLFVLAILNTFTADR